MSKSMSNRLNLSIVSVACVLTCVMAQARAQEAQETRIQNHITVTEQDIAAANSAKTAFFHVMPAHVEGAKERVAALHAENQRRLEDAGLATPGAPVRNVLTAPYFYPADMQKGTGGTLATTTQHALYVNYTGTIAANWGNPEQFLKDLNASTFIHLVDQYAGSKASNRYPVGANLTVTYTLYGTNVLYEHDILAIVHGAAVKYGSGTGHLYHVFLPQGIDTCFDLTKQCYSPDKPTFWTFCAYHDSVNFGGSLGEVYFTVEPYQDVNGCAEATPASPQGLLADSTNTALSHEAFEAISDPIPGLGYSNRNTAFPGQEIGDECYSPVNALGNELDPTLNLNGKLYKVQLEYSNTYHACAAVP